MYDFPYRLEYLFSYNATLQTPRERIGPTLTGFRANAFIAAGDVTGPRLQ